MTREIQDGLAVYAAALNALFAAYHARAFPNLKPDTVTIEIRKKYAKVVSTDSNGNRSSYSYVDLATGDVVKGNWKGPERAVLHIKRGNVVTGSWLEWHGPHGIGYADRHGEFARMLGADVLAVAKDAIQEIGTAKVTELITQAIAARKP